MAILCVTNNISGEKEVVWCHHLACRAKLAHHIGQCFCFMDLNVLTIFFSI
jgi:hypothetical protein